MKRNFLLLNLVLLLMLSSLLVACVNEKVDVPVAINLTNSASSPYTIWIGHDKTISPKNEIVANGSRTDTVTMNAEGPTKDQIDTLRDSLRVNVAKDGKIIATEKLEIDTTYVSGMTLNVIWDGTSVRIQY